MAYTNQVSWYETAFAIIRFGTGEQFLLANQLLLDDIFPHVSVPMSYTDRVCTTRVTSFAYQRMTCLLPSYSSKTGKIACFLIA